MRCKHCLVESRKLRHRHLGTPSLDNGYLGSKRCSGKGRPRLGEQFARRTSRRKGHELALVALKHALGDVAMKVVRRAVASEVVRHANVVAVLLGVGLLVARIVHEDLGALGQRVQVTQAELA